MTPEEREVMELALEALENNKRTHYYCDDKWYSCPKHEDGCANDSAGDECNCGADKVNAKIDKAITAIKAALEAHKALAQQSNEQVELDDFELLPVDPTIEMKNAAINVELFDHDTGKDYLLSWEEVEQIYSAMLNAAPTHPPTPWTAKQIKEYAQQQRAQLPEAPL